LFTAPFHNQQLKIHITSPSAMLIGSGSPEPH
jgi:hypothetical protein